MSAPSSPAAAASPWSRDAWSEPLPTEIFTVEPQGPELDAAGLGVAIALEALMQDWYRPGWLPAPFNERLAPLCGLGAPIPSFVFTHHNHEMGFPPRGVLRQFVMVLVERLHLRVEELVLAYACVERALLTHPTLMRTYSVRSMLLGGCVIACKVSRDSDVKVIDCFYRLSDVLNSLELELLVHIEHQMLEVLHWRLPMGRVYQTYADSLRRSLPRAPTVQWSLRHPIEETEANVYGWSSARASPKAASPKAAEAPGAVRSAPAPERTFNRSHGPSCVLSGIDMLKPSRPPKIESLRQ